jgi:hypothetical protein
MFTNVEDAQTITSTMKSLMEVPFFQMSQVSKNPEWKSIIDAWFRKFRVSINLNNFLIILIRLVY